MPHAWNTGSLRGARRRSPADGPMPESDQSRGPLAEVGTCPDDDQAKGRRRREHYDSLFNGQHRRLTRIGALEEDAGVRIFPVRTIQDRTSVSGFDRETFGPAFLDKQPGQVMTGGGNIKE